jgi:spermidine/putrescine-binding protein
MRTIYRLLAVLLIAASSAAQAAGPALARELHLFNWDRYIDPQLLKDFEKAFGVRVIEDHFASNEDLIAKLQAGASGYDVVVPSDYTVRILARQKLLAKLDHVALPNLKHLAARFRAPGYDPQLEYSVPYIWGTSGIGYDSRRVQPAPAGWDDLFNPDKLRRHKGRVSMLNDMREAIGAALIYRGYSPNTTDPKQLDAAKEVLLRQKPFLAKYDSEAYKDSLAAGETLLAHGWSGEVLAMRQVNPRLAYAEPKEGTFLFVDNLCIPARSTRQPTALAFINFMLRPEVAARNASFLRYPTPNAAAHKLIDPKLPGATYQPDPKRKYYSIEDIGEAGRLYEKVWTEVKAR